MACTSCGKNKSMGYKTVQRTGNHQTTKPAGGGGFKKSKPVVNTTAFSTKAGSSFVGVKQSTHSGRTPISHASSGRTRRH